MINYKFISLPKIYKYLNGNEWLLFTVLFDEWQLMKNEEGYFFRSWNSLKKDTGLSNDGLNRALKGLIDKKFISKKTYEKKTQKSNDYRIEVDYIDSLIPTPKTEKASPKIGVTYSEKRSTSKEERTKEKINKTIDTIGPSTRNSADEKYEESTLYFDSSSKTRSELESEHYDTVVLPQLRRVEQWDENPEPDGFNEISVMSGWCDFPQAADWFEADIRSKVSEDDWNRYLCINFNRVKDKYLQRFRSKVA